MYKAGDGTLLPRCMWVRVWRRLRRIRIASCWRFSGLVEPLGFVDYVVEGASLVEADAVVDEYFGAAVVDVWAVSGDVGGHDDVGHAPEGVVGREGLGLVDV